MNKSTTIEASTIMETTAQRLEPEIRAFIARCQNHFTADAVAAPLEEQRAMYRDLCLSFAQPHPSGLEIEDRLVTANDHDIPIRTFAPASGINLPCILFLHGGSWMLGDLESHDDIAADIAARTGAKVVLVDYRLAPEHPYPAGLEDCYSVLCHLVEQAAELSINRQRLAVFGDSAGGNLAAALTLLVRDRLDLILPKPALCGQVLLYPALGTDFTLPSYIKNAQAPLLPAEDMQYYWRCYLNGTMDQVAAYAAPLNAGDLSGLPPTFIVTAQFDPLRDDGSRYAELLREQSVKVEYREAPGLVHGFIRARVESPASREAFEAVCGALKKMLKTSY